VTNQEFLRLMTGQQRSTEKEDSRIKSRSCAGALDDLGLKNHMLMNMAFTCIKLKD
jgi:hypothetical protein